MSPKRRGWDGSPLDKMVLDNPSAICWLGGDAAVEYRWVLVLVLVLSDTVDDIGLNASVDDNARRKRLKIFIIVFFIDLILFGFIQFNDFHKKVCI